MTKLFINKSTKYQDKRTRRYAYVIQIGNGFVKIQFLSNKYEDWYSDKDFIKFFRSSE